NEVPAGQTGLVYMKMGTSTFDYYKDEAKTLASRARGMFTVGDIGYLDADGYLFICDRKSDMIISGGVNIYPAEIESALAAHPAVGDVAVFGIPHEEWGEEIKAVVQLVPGTPGAEPGPALTAELLAFAGVRLARFKLPRTIDSVAGLPTAGNTHEVALDVCPRTRVVYVDNDPVVLAHARDMLHGVPSAAVISQDMLQPEKILADPAVRELIDFGEPVALLFLSILH